MEEMIPCAVKDQEVFQRVWQRVMAGRDDAQCPIEALPAHLQGDLSCGCLDALVRDQGEGRPSECKHQERLAEFMAQQPGWQPVEDMPAPEAPAEQPSQPQPASEGCGGGSSEEPTAPESPEPPVETPPVPECPEPPAETPPVPEQPEPPAETPSVPECPPEADVLPPSDGPHQGSDLPQLWEASQETPDRTARLRQQVMESLEGWQFYRHLARRTRAGEARVLNGLAGELHRQARKLSAAYFLLTGLRYWPSELLTTPVIQSYWGALRQRHQAEQRQETAFRIAADDWDDPDLLALYAELIEACQRRCHQLRALLERDET